MLEIYIPNCNQPILMDLEDWDWIRNYRVSRMTFKPGLKRYLRISSSQFNTRFLHKLIMGVTDEKIKVDHINGNILDNRKENLRKCSQQQNNHNRRKMRGTSSKYKGVYFSKCSGKYVAQIRLLNGVRKHLGSFINEDDAGHAYNEAAKRLFGEFSSLNMVNNKVSNAQQA